MKKNMIISMIKSGWNFNEIRDLMRESKRIEKLLVKEKHLKKYDNKQKIIDFTNVKEYYCYKHECYHKKFRYTTVNGKSIKVKTDSFVKCKDNVYQLIKGVR